MILAKHNTVKDKSQHAHTYRNVTASVDLGCFNHTAHTVYVSNGAYTIETPATTYTYTDFFTKEQNAIVVQQRTYSAAKGSRKWDTLLQKETSLEGYDFVSFLITHDELSRDDVFIPSLNLLVSYSSTRAMENHPANKKNIDQKIDSILSGDNQAAVKLLMNDPEGRVKGIYFAVNDLIAYSQVTNLSTMDAYCTLYVLNDQGTYDRYTLDAEEILEKGVYVQSFKECPEKSMMISPDRYEITRHIYERHHGVDKKKNQVLVDQKLDELREDIRKLKNENTKLQEENTQYKRTDDLHKQAQVLQQKNKSDFLKMFGDVIKTIAAVITSILGLFILIKKQK